MSHLLGVGAMKTLQLLLVLPVALLLACSSDGGDATGPSELDLTGSFVGAYTASSNPGVVFTAVLQLQQRAADLSGSLATDADRLASLAASLSGSELGGLMVFTDGCNGTAEFTADALSGGNRIKGTYQASDCLGQYTGTFDLVRNANPPQFGAGGDFALSFDGNDGTETPDSNDLDFTDTFTFEGWLKPNATERPGQAGQTILAKWGLSVSASYGVGIGSDGHLHLVTHTPGASPDNTKLFSAEVLPAGVWTHFAYVFDHGDVRLYLNGQFNAERTGMNTPQVTSSLVTLGRQKSPEGFIGNYFAGVLDEVRLWNVARTQAQIESSFDGQVSASAPGLVAYWRMDEGSGGVAADLTGNGHDMQLGDGSGSDGADPTWVSAGR